MSDPKASREHREVAHAYGQQHAADLRDPKSSAFIAYHHVQYVLPWRVEDEEALAALLDGVAAAARAPLEAQVAALHRYLTVHDVAQSAKIHIDAMQLLEDVAGAAAAFEQRVRAAALEEAARIIESAHEERDEALLARADAISDHEDAAQLRKERHTRIVAERHLLRVRIAARVRALSTPAPVPDAGAQDAKEGE